MNCKNCGKEVQENWAMCPFCGTKIEKKKLCTNCGAELQSNWMMCPFCGQKANAAPSAFGATTQNSATNISPKAVNVGATGSILPVGNTSDDILPSDLDLGFDLQQPAQNNTSNYQKKLNLARITCIRKDFDKAKKMYDDMLQDDPEDVNAYIGLVRIATQNYKIFDGDEIAEAIRIAQEIAGTDISTLDADLAAYLPKRAQHLQQLAQQQQQLAQAQRLAKEEAARKAQEEMERQAAWQKAHFEKEKLLQALTTQLQQERNADEEMEATYQKALQEFEKGFKDTINIRAYSRNAVDLLKGAPSTKLAQNKDALLLIAKCMAQLEYGWYGKVSGCYYEAANAGSVEAQLWLAYQYRIRFKDHYTPDRFGLHDGLKWPAHIKTAEKWYLMAAEQGSLDAYKGLASFYEEQKNYAEAKKWYKKAGDAGDVQSKLALKRLQNM